MNPLPAKARTLIFVSSHRRHMKVADRLLGALRAGRKVELLAFDRGSVDHRVYSDTNIRHTSLGPMRDGASVARLWAFARAASILLRRRRDIVQTDTVLLVNTLEMLVLSWLCGLTRLPTIYDVCDIHTLLLSPSIWGRTARWLERRALHHVGLLVVTSPWFYWEYFAPWQRAPKAALLIENKVEWRGATPVVRRTLGNAIAWNGLLRCRRSAQVLLETLNGTPGALRLSLHGTLTRLGELGPRLLSCPDCSYIGEYDPATLGKLLSASSFLWAVDFADGENSRWLLPNRLYEAIDAAIPLIAVDNSATGAVVRRRDIGLVLSECTPTALLQALGSCTSAQYETWLKNMRELKGRAQRGDEWQRVFEQDGDWSDLNTLPNAIDLGLVLCAATDDAVVRVEPRVLDA